MKNKKIIFFTIIILVILLSTIAVILLSKSKKKENLNNITEYTPQEEMSDEKVRKTIISLYFKNIETNSLIAEAKCIDVKNLLNNSYSYLINLLITGPESDKLESTIPEGTKVNSCTLKGDIVYVDLSREFIDNAVADEESMIVYSITNTLTELNEVSGVKFLINGEENLSFKDNKINFKEVFVKND